VTKIITGTKKVVNVFNVTMSPVKGALVLTSVMCAPFILVLQKMELVNVKLVSGWNTLNIIICQLSVFHVLKTALIARITFLEHAIFVMKVIR
jgi:hypothetical protein